MCVYSHVCELVCAHMWMPEADINSLSPSVSTLFIEAGPLNLTQSSLQGSPISTFGMLGLPLDCHTHSTALEIQTQLFTPVRPEHCPVIHFTSPVSTDWLIVFNRVAGTHLVWHLLIMRFFVSFCYLLSKYLLILFHVS